MVINATSYSVIGITALKGGYAYGIAYDSNNGNIYTTVSPLIFPNNYYVAELNVSSGSVSYGILPSQGYHPHNEIYSSAVNELFVAQSYGISIVNPSNLSVVKFIPLVNRRIGGLPSLSLLGDILYVTGYSSNITELNIHTESHSNHRK